MTKPALVLLVAVGSLSACAAATPQPDAAPPASLRVQLTQPVRLAIDPLESTGEVTARERTGASWLPSQVPLAITGGELTVTARDRELVLSGLEVDVAPIALPMLPGDAKLTAIAVRLPAPTPIGVTWQDDDDAVALATLDLQLAWSLSAGGGTLPLGTQHLAAVPIAIALHGVRGTATAAIGIDQPGELWRWADLVALADLSLQLPARTAPPPLR